MEEIDMARCLAMVALVLTCLSLASPSHAQEAPEPELVTREFVLRHVDVKEANAMVRSLANVRKVAIDEERQALLVRDEAGRVEMIAGIVAKVDQPRPKWRVRLVAGSGGEDVVVREAPLSASRATLRFGATTEGSDHLMLAVEARRAAESEVDAA